MIKKIVLLGFLIIISLLAAGCEGEEAISPDYSGTLPPLCQQAQPKDIDGAILNDVEFILKNYSVFTSPFLKDVFTETDYDNKIKSINKGNSPRAIIEEMIHATGDPFSAYLTAEQWAIISTGDMVGAYRGLGVVIRKNDKDKEFLIEKVMPGSPAEKAGLKPGDSILAVDGKSAEICNLDQLTLYLRTKNNPNTELIVRSGSASILKRVKVVLGEIKLQMIWTWPGVDFPNNRGSTSFGSPYLSPLQDRDGEQRPEIFYIKIREFTAQMAVDLLYVLLNFDIDELQGLVVDLRGNPGGELGAVLNSVDYFLPKEELIIATRYFDGSVVRFGQNRFTLLPEEKPLAILIDEKSASAAEIFAAALRDNKRAVIISANERSAGKGSVNRFFPLRNGEYGALYVSIGLWYTPSGGMIEKRDLDNDGYYEIGGIKPDILVKQKNPSYDPVIIEAVEWIKQKLPK